MLLRLVLSLALVITCTSCNIPRDPNHTLERVSGGTMRVGVVENSPWVKRVNGEPFGVEVSLIRSFASELGANIDWVWGSLEDHLEALKHHELDLAIGGLTKSTPWQNEIGLTNPFFTNRYAVGVKRSIPPMGDLKGVSVAVKQGSVVAAYLKEKKAVPVRVENPFAASKPVAAPQWQLQQQEFTLTTIELHRDEHVMAVPPGENGWLMRLENFLIGQREQVEKMLQQAQP